MHNNILEAVRQGYVLCWQERYYLARLSFFPILIKLLNAILIMHFQIPTSSFYYGVAMLPSFMAGGWVIAQFLRTVLTGERWPIKIEGSVEDNMDFLMQRARGLLSCILIFTCIAYFQSGLVVLMSPLLTMTEQQAAAGIYKDSSVAILMAFALIGVMIWAFRLIWIHIPAVLLLPVMDFLKQIKGFGSSAYLICVWLICIIPVFGFFSVLARFILGDASSLQTAPALSSFSLIFLYAAIETIVNVIATVAIASMFQDFFKAYGFQKTLFLKHGES